MPLSQVSLRLHNETNFYADLQSGMSEGARERILIVDDSPVILKAFLNTLSERYDCLSATSVIESFELLKSESFDLVITDILMPGLSGIELLRKVIDSYPQTAVVVVSGVDRPQRALDAMRLGAFDYLIKPCDASILSMTVERALERRSLIMNAQRYKRDLEERNEQLVKGKAQLERLQAQIVQSEKMASIGQLAAGVAHEINNPVGFVYGNLDLLEGCIADLLELLKFYDNALLSTEAAAEAAAIKRRIDYERSAEDLCSIVADCRAGTERIRDIVQNLRTFSRLDEAEFKKTDVHEGIDSSIRILSRYFSGAGITLIREYGNLPEIEAFSAQLNQVWMNLLANAAQAIGSRAGEVRITTWIEADNVVVAVSDTGSGIRKEILTKIFDPFFTTKPVGEGTGLGLSITFGIVGRHSGRIEVDSSHKGTTFRVTLPQRLNGPERSRQIGPHVASSIVQEYAI